LRFVLCRSCARLLAGFVTDAVVLAGGA